MALHDPLITAGKGDLARHGVVLLHGFTGSPESIRPWAENLARAGYAVHMPLLAGHGTQWEDMAHTSWKDWYASAEQAYFELRQRCDRVYVAGLSMGGTLALRLAEHHPVAGLALVNPAMRLPNLSAYFAGVLKHALPRVPAIGSDIKKPGADEYAYEQTPVASVEQIQLLFRDTKPALPLVKAPLILFRSTVDHVVSDSSTTDILQGVGSTEIQLLKLQNSYHVATVDYDAEKIFSRSRQFFQEFAT